MKKLKRKVNSSLDGNTSFWDKCAMFILAFIASVIPLIVRLQQIDLTDSQKKYWTGKSTVIDVFSYVKSQFLIIALVMLVTYWLIKLVQKSNIPFSKIFIFVFTYIVMAILSTLFSEYKDIALMGFVDRYEGLFILISYVLTMFTAFVLVRDEKRANTIIVALMISAFIMGIIGISQFFGFDILQTNWGRHLIVPSEFEGMAEKLSFNFAGQKVMYTTVYNPNYLGSYSVLILPISIALFFYYLGKSNKKALFMFIASLMAFTLWLGGLSRAGLVGGIALLILLIFFLRKIIITQWKASLGLLLGFIIIYAGMDVYSGGLVTKEFVDTMPSSISTDGEYQNKPGTAESTQRKPVKSALLRQNVFSFETESEAFVMKLEGDSLGFYNGQGKQLYIEQEENKITFTDEGYEHYSVEMDESVAYLRYADVLMPFLFSDNKMLYAPTPRLFYEEVDEVPSWGFENHLNFGSGRGYLWARSIPLIKNTLLLGHGPDTFSIYFPQQDIAGKINNLFSATVLADKPHNWYLQVGINTGVVSLIALLVFLGWFIIKSLIHWLKPQESYDYFIGVSTVCAIIGYCIAGIFNDSNVAVAPVFWILLGIGLAFLHKNKDVKIQPR